MLICEDDISNVIILGMCFSIFVYICARLHFVLIGGNLTAHVYGELQGNWMWNSNSKDIHVVCKLSFLFPFPPRERPGELARRLVVLDCATTGS